MRVKQLLLSLLAFAVILTACGTTETPDVGDTDPDPDPTPTPTVNYTLAAAIGPATVVSRDGSTSTGLASQVYLYSTETADENLPFQITILDENEEQIGGTTELRQWKDFKTGNINVDRPNFSYKPGRYTVVASRDGEEVARQEYDLTDTTGLPAPERITAEVRLEDVRVDFGSINAATITAAFINRSTGLPLFKGVPNDAENATFEYDDRFALDRETAYDFYLRATEARATGTESVLTRFLIVNRFEVELREVIEPFVTSVIAKDASGNEGILLLSGLTQPFGAPDTDGYANFKYRIGEDEVEGLPRGYWEVGDRVIHASPYFITFSGLGLTTDEVLGDKPITVTAFLGEDEYMATLDTRPLPQPLGTAPSNLVLTTTEDGLSLAWEDVADASNYLVVVTDLEDNSNTTFAYSTEPNLDLENSEAFTAGPSTTYNVMVIAIDGEPTSSETGFLSGSYLIHDDSAPR